MELSDLEVYELTAFAWEVISAHLGAEDVLVVTVITRTVQGGAANDLLDLR
jgi:hypothetical protein